MFRSLRWLYPGLKIKRWFVVIFLGVIVSSMGTVFLAIALFQFRDPEEGGGVGLVGSILG